MYKGHLWLKMLKYIYFSNCFHAVLYIVLKRHVPLPIFPETFSMWCRGIFGTKWHRFHYCCNLWWVQPLYCINTLDYKWPLSRPTLPGLLISSKAKQFTFTKIPSMIIWSLNKTLRCIMYLVFMYKFLMSSEVQSPAYSSDMLVTFLCLLTD